MFDLDQYILTGWRYRTPQKVLFVEELTEIMTNSFPDFWKLGQAYISGSLQMKEVGFQMYNDENISLKDNLSNAGWSYVAKSVYTSTQLD